MNGGKFAASVRVVTTVLILACAADRAAADDNASVETLMEQAAAAGKAAAHDEAIRLYSQAIAREGLQQRAGQWARVCEFGRAMEDYTHVIALAPRHGPAYSLRGYLRGLCGLHAQAVLDHRQAAELADRFNKKDYLAWALQHEADMWRRRGAFDKALAVCVQALEADDYPTVHFRMAWIHLDRGDDAAAKAAYAIFKSKKPSLQGMWPDERIALERLERLSGTAPQ